MSNRGTFVYRNGRVVEKGGPDDVREPRGPASSLPRPMLIRDGMDALRGMHDGRLYESKSELRRSYREQGYAELGNDAPLAPRDNSRPITKDEIGAALQKVRQGYKPPPLEYGALPIADE